MDEKLFSVPEGNGPKFNDAASTCYTCRDSSNMFILKKNYQKEISKPLMNFHKIPRLTYQVKIINFTLTERVP